MNTRQKGFTIVEMIIVVVVIALLAMITVFAFNNYRARTARTEMKNELIQASTSVKNHRNYSDAYPINQVAFDAVYSEGSNVVLAYSSNATGSGFCIKATSTAETTLPAWYISSVSAQPVTAVPTVPGVTCP